MENIGNEEKKLKTPPMTVACYICGGKYTKHSIAVHEKQCLKKWHTENDHLPAKSRPPVPVRAEQPPQSSSSNDDREDSLAENATEQENSPENAPPPFPCYLCERIFTVYDIYQHEEECLKRWKEENDKLPPSKRKQVPLKPDIKFTPTGEVDFQGTFNRIWDNHLAELVPCDRCGRTFAPDRLEVHYNSCKGDKRRKAK